MNEYTYIIFDHNGRRLGKIEFGVRNSVPSAKEIKEAIKIAHTNNAIFLFDYIAGDVVLCEDKEVQ